MVHKLIGKQIKIVHSNNTSLKDVEGKVVNETQNTLEILCLDGKIRKVFKRSAVFALKHNKKIIIIKGKQFLKKPESR